MVQYVRYNTMLRHYPEDVHTAFKSGGNTFATTIFVLVSAVQKIARVMPIPEGIVLYRGLGGMELPERFTRGGGGIGCGDDESQQHGAAAATGGGGWGSGARGYTEWGFMSTTANKATAVEYSGVGKGKPKAMVMEISPNAVDRGASIAAFSQWVEHVLVHFVNGFLVSFAVIRTHSRWHAGVFVCVVVRYPGEEEYVWVPCSFVQPRGDAGMEIVAEGLITV